MNPPYALSADDQAALHAELSAPAYADLTDVRRFDALHAPTAIPNPTPQGQVPKPYHTADLLGLLSAASVVNLKQISGAIGAIIADIDAANTAGLLNWAAVLLGWGEISQAEHDAIAALVTATVPDPAWTATVPGPSRRRAIFGDATWTIQAPRGPVTYSYVPLPDVEAAR